MSNDPYGQHLPRTQHIPGPYGPPAHPHGAPPMYGPPAQFQPPAPKKVRPLVIVAAVVGGLVLLCTIGAGIAASSDSGKPSATVVAPGASVKGRATPGKAAKKPSAKEPFNAAVGSTITATDGDGNTIEATLRSVRSVTKTCTSFDDGPKSGFYVIVDVLVVQTAGAGSVNPLDFTFVAADGTSSDELAGSFSGCAEPGLDSANLRTGQKRAGKMAFDATSRAGTLEWAPGGIGADTVGSWKTT